MGTNLAQPCEKAICSDDSRGSNVGPSNSCVEGSQPAHYVNCKDEKKSEAPETNAMENMMERQSNNGDESGIVDGDGLMNSSAGKKEKLTENSHLRDNGLNDKKEKVGKEGIVGVKENSYLRSNGLNYKILKSVNKGKKIGRKEKENSLVRDNGLNNKIIEMAAEWNGSRAESNRKFQSQMVAEWNGNRAESKRKFRSQMAAEWNESRAESNRKFRMQRQKEMEAEEDEYDGYWNRYSQKQYEWQNEVQSRPRRHESGMTFTVRSVSNGDSEGENRFVRINGLNKSNPVYKLESVLRICNQETQSRPDMFGCIRRNPRAEHNPLLCNLNDREATQYTKEAVIKILYSMLNKIPEHQIECSTIRGIESHRIKRFDRVETEVIQERIKAILIGAVSGRVGKTLKDDEVSVYDEGTKDYIESNRLLDHISEFLWKAGRKADLYWSTD